MKFSIQLITATFAFAFLTPLVGISNAQGAELGTDDFSGNSITEISEHKDYDEEKDKHKDDYEDKEYDKDKYEDEDEDEDEPSRSYKVDYYEKDDDGKTCYKVEKD